MRAAVKAAVAAQRPVAALVLGQRYQSWTQPAGSNAVRILSGASGQLQPVSRVKKQKSVQIEAAIQPYHKFTT